MICSIGAKSQYKINIDLTPQEQDLFEESIEAFENSDFVKSYQGFSQLLSLYPREEAFNYAYGASMIRINEDPKKGIDYLVFAANKGIYQSNFYIGLGYHYMYDFSNAIVFFEKFKSLAKNKEIEKFEIEKHISMARNGQELIKYAYELQVLSNKKTSLGNFHYSYDLDNFGGKLIVKTEQFKGKADKQIKGLDLMYISEINKIILLSSYGESKKNSLDIYISYKTKTGWSKPQKLPDIINTQYDEAYPFLSEDGNTLYFSSKGHNSMGGYDIFRSYYNSKKNTWSTPENLDFPINTPFDEIMFASDRFNETAYFASSRQSKNEKISVYRILMEKNPDTRQLASMEDIYQHASLNINPVALAELTKRQEVRANAMIDTSGNRENIIATNDTAVDADILIQKSRNLLGQKSDIANEFLEYAASAYKIAELALDEVRDLNRELKALKNKTDNTSVTKREQINTEIITKSQQATELYDLTKYFRSYGSQALGKIQYYSDELTALDNISRNESSLISQINELHSQITTLKSGVPYEEYLAIIDKEIESTSTKRNVYKTKIEDNLVKLDNINEKINLKLELAQKETEFSVREKYIYDIKTYENQKIDLISKIKEDQVQIEFINHDIEILNLRKGIIADSKTFLDENLTNEPNLDISKINNEIDLLKAHLSQESLSDLAKIQDRILADNQYYSEKVDYDAILYASNDNNDFNVDNIFIDTDSHNEKFSNIVSTEILDVGTLINDNDSLNNIITSLEYRFDTSSNQSEKQALIEEINTVQSDLDKNLSKINTTLSTVDIIDAKQEILEFENLKLSPNSDPEEISKLEKLIIESHELEQEIDDLKILIKTNETPAIKYLETIKSEVDKEIIANVETLRATSIIANSDISDEELISDLNNRIVSIQYPDFENEQKQITDDLQEAEKLLANAAKQNKPEKKNDLILQANKLLDGAIPKNIELLNNLLVADYEVYSTYNSAFATYQNKTEQTTEVYNTAKTLQDDAAALQMEAEETSDELAKMQKLALAYDKMQLANKYYAYVFEIVGDENKYEENYTIEPDKSTEDLVAISNSIERIETIEATQETIKNIELTKVQQLINDSKKIQEDISRLQERYSMAQPDRRNDILEEMELLNLELNSKLIAANREIVIVQKDIILENIDLIKRENPDSDLVDIETLVEAYNNKAENGINTNDYYLLGEVIIEGENLLQRQNDLLLNKTILAQFDNEINSLRNTAQLNDEFIIKSNDDINTASNNLNNDNNSQKLNSVITKLDGVNIATGIKSQNDNQTRIFEKLNSKKEEILALNAKIENTTKQNTINKLKTDLRALESEQIKQLIAFSESRSKLISELNSITKIEIETASIQSDTIYSNLLVQHEEIRNSIINYSNFYTLEELETKHAEALEIENKILDYQIEYIAKLDTETIEINLVSNDTTHQDSTSNYDIAVNSDTTTNELDKYEFNYNYDKDTEIQINKLETKINSINTDISISEIKIEELELAMENSNSIVDYNKLQKELEKANKKYLKQIKIWTNLNKDRINLTYDFADNLYYSDNTTPERISIVTDSIKNISDDDINESLALFNVIIGYNAKVADADIIETYKRAESLSASGISNLNAANDLKSRNDESDPIILAHYRSTETSNDNTIPTDTSTNITEATFVNDTSILAVNIDTLPDIDTIPEVNSLPDADTTSLASNNNHTNTINQADILSVLKTEDNTFDTNTESLYSDENPIESITVENELCYRIQIGAYFEPVSNEKFKGISPIFMENITDSRYIRYMVGLFYTFNSASGSLPTVRGLGYGDAFIVAYYNGQRISIYEARRIEENLMREAQESILATNSTSDQDTSTNNQINNDLDVNTHETNDTSSNIAENNIPENNNENKSELTETSGVFFCIQIGVYGSRLGPERLYNLNPIMYHNYANGLVRHTVGKYFDINKAINEQNKIRGIGIKDAFVIAYNNGERITTNEAKNLLAGNTNTPTDEIEVIIPENIFRENNVANNTTTNNNDVETPDDNNTEEITPKEYVIEYYVQIGVFRRDVSFYVKNRFEQIAGNSELIRQTNNNLTLYRIGTFTTYEAAQEMLSSARNGGVNDAFIVAFVNGKKTTVKRATSLSK